MPVEKKGSKGSSPKVHQYFKVEGDKVTKIKKLFKMWKRSIHVRA